MKSVSYGIHKRVAPISHRIDAVLKQSGLPAKTFCHDMTFGNGMGAMLHSHDELVTRYYSSQDIPFVFTNEKGRTLADGAYLSKYVYAPITEYRRLLSWVKQSFTFRHMLSIAINEKDQQQLFTFFFDCTEAQFMQHMVKHYYFYQQFIRRYQTLFADVIDDERENHQAQFPLSDIKLSDDQSILFDDENKNELFFPKNIIADVVSILSPQQTKCLSLLGQGMTARDIALDMQLSVRTVEHYIAAIKQKLNVKNTKELIAKYVA